MDSKVFKKMQKDKNGYNKDKYKTDARENEDGRIASRLRDAM